MMVARKIVTPLLLLLVSSIASLSWFSSAMPKIQAQAALEAMNPVSPYPPDIHFALSILSFLAVVVPLASLFMLLIRVAGTIETSQTANPGSE